MSLFEHTIALQVHKPYHPLCKRLRNPRITYEMAKNAKFMMKGPGLLSANYFIQVSSIICCYHHYKSTSQSLHFRCEQRSSRTLVQSGRPRYWTPLWRGRFFTSTRTQNICPFQGDSSFSNIFVKATYFLVSQISRPFEQEPIPSACIVWTPLVARVSRGEQIDVATVLPS